MMREEGKSKDGGRVRRVRDVHAQTTNLGWSSIKGADDLVEQPDVEVGREVEDGLGRWETARASARGDQRRQEGASERGAVNSCQRGRALTSISLLAA